VGHDTSPIANPSQAGFGQELIRNTKSRKGREWQTSKEPRDYGAVHPWELGRFVPMRTVAAERRKRVGSLATSASLRDAQSAEDRMPSTQP